MTGHILFAALGGFLLIMAIGGAIQETRRVHRMRTWLPATARVISFRVVEQRGDEGTYYPVQLQYQYAADGSLYEGMTDITGRECDTVESAHGLSRTYGVGCALPIVYHPRRVAQSLPVDERHRQPDKSAILSAILMGSFGFVLLVAEVLPLLSPTK